MSKSNLLKIIAVAMLIGLMSVSCKKSQLLDPDKQETSLDVTLKGLNAPAPIARYVLWAVYDSAKIELYSQIDSFEIAGNAQSIALHYDMNLGVLQKMTTLLVSMETEDSLTKPSDYKVLAAGLKANTGTFSIGDDYLLKFDVATATATYKLVKSDSSDNIIGIWFVKGDSTLEPGLSLPDAKGLWKYTSYIIKDGKRYNMGDFVSADGSDASNEYGERVYKYPGENFEKDPTTGQPLKMDLRGAEVYVEIIPPTIYYDSNGDGQKEAYPPFKLVMFKGQIPQDATVNTEYQLENNSASFPTGTATININLFK